MYILYIYVYTQACICRNDDYKTRNRNRSFPIFCISVPSDENLFIKIQVEGKNFSLS